MDTIKGNWQKRQISMIMASSISMFFGTLATFSAVYWIFSETSLPYIKLWWLLGLTHLVLIFCILRLLRSLVQQKKFFKQKDIVTYFNILISIEAAMWLYPSLFGYQLLNMEYQAVYTVIIAGMSSGAVVTVLHDQKTALIQVAVFLVPYIYASAMTGSNVGYMLASLAFVFMAAIIHQALIFNSMIKKEFLLGEQNRILLTENQQNTEKLINTSKMVSIGQMAGGIAHEINTPLAIISGSVTVLKSLKERKELDDSFLDKSLDTIQNTVTRIARIVSGLKIVSRDGTKTEMDFINTEEVFSDILGLCSEKFKSIGIKIESNIQSQEAPKKIYCDRVQLSQTLLNLLNNAHDVIIETKDPWIKVLFIEEPTDIKIQVINSGPKIEKELSERVFDPFYTSKPVGKSTGLGLS
ncbi:MAG: ATP-binding protein, partial [Bdellovibrionales bacterium]|nr:ATP-binding protein [Bdellovibrionales bacterium]